MHGKINLLARRIIQQSWIDKNEVPDNFEKELSELLMEFGFSLYYYKLNQNRELYMIQSIGDTINTQNYSSMDEIRPELRKLYQFQISEKNYNFLHSALDDQPNCVYFIQEFNDNDFLQMLIDRLYVQQVTDEMRSWKKHFSKIVQKKMEQNKSLFYFTERLLIELRNDDFKCTICGLPVSLGAQCEQCGNFRHLWCSETCCSADDDL